MYHHQGIVMLTIVGKTAIIMIMIMIVTRGARSKMVGERKARLILILQPSNILFL